MSTRAVTRSSLYNRHTIMLWAPWLIVKRNRHIHIKKKKKSEPTCLLKPVRTHDGHKPFITLAFLGAKGHSPRNRRKLPSTLKNFGNKSPYPITDANSNIDSHSKSPLKWQRRITTPIIPNLLLLSSWWLCR